MKADAKTEAEVMAVLNQLIEAYKKQDLDGILALYAPDPDVVTIGTGVDEKRIGLVEKRAQLERDFAQVEDISVQLDWYLISAAGSVAWVASDLVAQGKVAGQVASTPMRATFVLERRGGKWLIVQQHNSVPAAGQKEGESWPTGSS